MVVKVVEKVEFPNSGWLTTELVGPNSQGRVLVNILGHSGMSAWTEGLLTIPAEAIAEDESGHVSLLPGTYRVEEGQDKRGRRLLRFYFSEEQSQLPLLTFDGHLVAEASSENVVPLLQTEGYSRTRANGNRWSLIVAPIGSIVAIEPYWSDDPIYYQITEKGPKCLGASDAVLHPDEW